ncbi:MAG: hypothetical protein ACRDPC_01590 [Solirubrobacteraceae bacterium]
MHLPGVLTHRLIRSGAAPKKLKADNPLRDVWGALYSPEAEASLQAIKTACTTTRKGRRPETDWGKVAAVRRRILTMILARLIPSADPDADVEAPEEPLDQEEQASTELALLEGNLARLAKKKWGDVRVGVLVQFGALADGPREAIKRAIAYYAQLVKGEFLGREKDTLVHPKLQDALTRATIHVKLHRIAGLLSKEEEAELDAAASDWFSTNIRPNQNAKHRLSDHSFGWAIDIQSTKNPNIGTGGGLDPVKAVTGGRSAGLRDRGQELRADRGGGRGPAPHQPRVHSRDGERVHHQADPLPARQQGSGGRRPAAARGTGGR